MLEWSPDDDTKGKAAQAPAFVLDWRFTSFAAAGLCLQMAAQLEEVKLVLKLSPNAQLDQHSSTTFICSHVDCRDVVW